MALVLVFWDILKICIAYIWQVISNKELRILNIHFNYQLLMANYLIINT